MTNQEHPTFHIGQRVEHPMFGEGVVTSLPTTGQVVCTMDTPIGDGHGQVRALLPHSLKISRPAEIEPLDLTGISAQGREDGVFFHIKSGTMIVDKVRLSDNEALELADWLMERAGITVQPPPPTGKKADGASAGSQDERKARAEVDPFAEFVEKGLNALNDWVNDLGERLDTWHEETTKDL